MNLDTLEWDSEMLDIFGIPEECLPRIVKESSANFGTVQDGELKGTTIGGIVMGEFKSLLDPILPYEKILISPNFLLKIFINYLNHPNCW
jgi:acetoacetate decarboxylase